jgi:hypothetical protein
VHAIGSGGGAGRDLEASRSRLLAEGFVFKENFRDPYDGVLDDEAEEKFEVRKQCVHECTRSYRPRSYSNIDATGCCCFVFW